MTAPQTYIFDPFGEHAEDGHRVDHDRQQFRRALGAFPTGVAIVTTRVGDEDYGMTINSFASVSLNPPLVLWSVDESAACYDAFCAASHWAISLLTLDQEELAVRFARPVLRHEERFAPTPTHSGLGGSKLISGALATFECRRHADFPGGDHRILVGEVLRFVQGSGEPLLFHNGAFRRF